MTKFEQLRTALEKAQDTTGKALAIADGTFPGELAEVKGFFAEVLSATTLDIQQIDDDTRLIETSVEKQITVQGMAAVFGSPSVELTLVFTEGENEKLGYEVAAVIDPGIPIGEMATKLAALQSVVIPAAVEAAKVTGLEASYEPEASMGFSFFTEMETDVAPLATSILLNASKNGEPGWNKSLTGVLFVHDFEFEMSFGTADGTKTFTASLRPGELGEANLTDLFSHFVDVPEGILPDLTVAVENAYVTFTKPKDSQKGTVIFGIGVGVDMVFGDGLPLVGPMLNGQSIGVKTVLFSYASAEFQLKDLQKINLSLPKGKPKLPEMKLNGGIGISFSLAFGKVKQYISLPAAEPAEPTTPDAPPPPLTKPEREGKWFTVNKRMGPLSIIKVGVNFKDSVLTLGLDATLALGPLTLALDEFTMGSSIKAFSPVFGLHGFGLGWSGGPVEISGMFLRTTRTVGGREVDNFLGAALIKTPTLTLKAIGEFAMVQGNPSFYLYAYLGYPIGGPAFFFVEGLAVGFGFNRSVQMPTIDKVNSYPLVAMAVGGPQAGDPNPLFTLALDMAENDYVPIDLGKLFLAVGVRFTTFKQLDSFLLIIATFGKGFRLDLLGLSKLTVPSAGPGVKNPAPLAEVELAIMGTFAPDEGFIGVQAQLTKNSYILSRDCYLTGGFAFFTWFEPSEHAGDFVISLGGYHPKFVRPKHYPVVPRLGFNWQVSSEINVKGGMYFALTPTVLMAGGRLEATFRSGGLKAWFIIGADFIIGWKPFFYDAHMYLSLGVSYTFWFFGKQTISFDIGADLHIWGPAFSGTAYIDLGIVDFTVEFGAGASQTPKPIRYSEFEKSFLPAAKVASVSVTSGLLKEVKFGNEEVWVVNPKEFLLNTDSAVPSNTTKGLKEVRFGAESVWMASEDELFAWLDDPEKQMTDEVKPSIPFAGVTAKSQLKVVEVNRSQNIGIGTVGVKTDELITQHTVKVFKGNDDFTAEFLYEPATKSFPAALWGEKLLPDKNDKNRVITDLLAGLQVRPKPPGDPDQMGFLDQDEFKFQTLTIPNSIAMGRAGIFNKNDDDVRVEKGNPKRANVLSALGFDGDDFELDEDTDFGFAEQPLVGRYGLVGGDTF